jgi:hypothetical protein
VESGKVFSQGIVSLFVLAQFVIPMILMLAIPLYMMVFYMRNKSSAGAKIAAIYCKSRYLRLITITATVVVLLSIALIMMKAFVGYISLVFGISMIIIQLTRKKYAEISGVYENYIVTQEGVVKWTEIHSWKALAEQKLSFLKKDGIRVDYRLQTGYSAAVEWLAKNQIEEEK